MSDQENLSASREARAAILAHPGSRAQRYDVAFRRYLAAIAYHDDRATAAERLAPTEEQLEPHERDRLAEEPIRWDIGAASVRDVMTADVVSVEDTATFREMVETLTMRHISAVPVVDADHKVVGIVSESDLLAKLVTGGDPRARIKGSRRRTSVLRHKSQADTAAGLMTTAAVTTTPDTSIVQAARKAAAQFVRRMPVVDTSGVLVGIVTRSDMLRVFDRNDEDLRTHIIDDILRSEFCINPMTVGVTVEQGVVTLSGELEKQALVELLVKSVRSTLGVVNVHDKLSYRHADEPATPVIGPMY